MLTLKQPFYFDPREKLPSPSGVPEWKARGATPECAT